MKYTFSIILILFLWTAACFERAAEATDWPANITVNVTEGSIVSGTVTGVNPENVYVAVFVRTNEWYIQPYTTAWRIPVNTNGYYETWVHPWDQVSVFVIDNQYDALNNQDTYGVFPLSIDGTDVLGMNSYPSIRFSGYNWAIKRGNPLGPGNNSFSNSTDNVWVDTLGRLHLKITENGFGTWDCGEVYMMKSLGLGNYHFRISGSVKDLDKNVVASPFIYKDSVNELDIEFSQWCASITEDAQFVTQPYTTPGNLERFTMTGSAQSTHIIEWRAAKVDFLSADGHGSVPDPADIIHSWSYTGANIPAEDGERVHINLWLCDTAGPSDGKAQEFIVDSFTFYEKACSPPTSEDWNVTESCTVVTSSALEGNVIVQTGVTMNFAFDSALTMDWTKRSFTIKGKVVLENGGKIL